MRKAAMKLLVVAGALTATGAAPVLAQDQGKPSPSAARVLFENDQVKVQEVTYRPGHQTATFARPARVIRALEGGELRRVYPDGRTEDASFKSGEVKVYPAEPPFAVKNVGTTSVVLFVVAVKGVGK